MGQIKCSVESKLGHIFRKWFGYFQTSDRYSKLWCIPMRIVLVLKIERSVHEITVGHRSLSGTISFMTDRIRFLPVSMTGRFSNFNSISYTEDRHELHVTGAKCRLLEIVSGTSKIFISGAMYYWNLKNCQSLWPADNESCRSHMKSFRTVTDDRRLFHALHLASFKPLVLY